MLARITGYALAALGACALMVTTADATALVHGAEVKSRPSVQRQSQHGSLTARSPKSGSLPEGVAPKPDRRSGHSPKRRISKTSAAQSARWRTGRRRLCGRRCR